MIPYMHQEIAAEHIAGIREQARRDHLAVIAKRARQRRRRNTEPMPAPAPEARLSALRLRRATSNGQPPAAPKKVA